MSSCANIEPEQEQTRAAHCYQTLIGYRAPAIGNAQMNMNLERDTHD